MNNIVPEEKEENQKETIRKEMVKAQFINLVRNNVGTVLILE
jgi:hypothetical protein